ncbi:MAG TPA: hypothetical protein VFP80_05000 [Thermoanaerobaculia bacterium]|nr:hypothetical protein [Thermoanaerobaculia bacterium]
MSTLPAVADALLGIAAAMRTAGTRWYLFGAQAAIMWGSPRLSADVDITVDLPRETTAKLIDAMGDQGFDLAFSDREFVDRTRVLPFILARRDELDLDRVRSLLQLLEQALGQSDLLPALDAALRP